MCLMHAASAPPPMLRESLEALFTGTKYLALSLTITTKRIRIRTKIFDSENVMFLTLPDSSGKRLCNGTV